MVGAVLGGALVGGMVGDVVVVGAVTAVMSGAAPRRWWTEAEEVPQPAAGSVRPRAMTPPTTRRHRRAPVGSVLVQRRSTTAVGPVVLACLALLVSGCGGGDPGASRHLTTAKTTTTTEAATTTPSTTTSTAPPATTSTVPSFTATLSTVTAADLPSTWHPGCPVAPSELQMLHMSFWGFDGQPHVGTMVVNAAVVQAVLKVFSTLYGERFPISKMQPVDAYGGSDEASTADDNTAGFNCRYAVASGPPSWSMHAYGEAIDVDPVENPYIQGGRVQPPNGAAFTDRAEVRPGMAEPGGQLVAAFASVGWQWGGQWASTPDYQHFSTNGS